MPDLRRSELAAYAACLVLVAVLGWRALRAESAGVPASASTPARTTTGAAGNGATVRDAPAARVLVHVVGAVRRPGVYRLQEGQRVRDAVRRAGGGAAGADLEAVNLAAKLGDAQQVVVPRRRAAPTGSAASSGTGPSPPSASGGPISLNQASAEELDTLDGVGPATVQKILAFRQEHGGFSSVEDLGQIPGIGPKRLETLRAQVQL